MRPAGLGLGVLVFVVTGCATIMARGPDHVPVTTNPPGATVFVDNVPVGQTPMTVTLDRKRNAGLIRIELYGFAPVVVMRAPKINSWFWANLWLGGIGTMIDLATGNIKSFDETPISVGLMPDPDAPPPGRHRRLRRRRAVLRLSDSSALRVPGFSRHRLRPVPRIGRSRSAATRRGHDAQAVGHAIGDNQRRRKTSPPSHSRAR